MSVMHETCVADVVFADSYESPALVDPQAYMEAEADVWTQNLDATRVSVESLQAFLELLYGCDTEYMEQVAEHLPEPVAEVEEPRLGASLVDWSTVSAALGESQKILIGVQELLAETLAEMGIEDSRDIHVYTDTNGTMRLVSEHERQYEIEMALNSDRNRPLRQLYDAALNGMSVAGGLIGTVSLPKEVLERLQRKIHAQAS